MNIRQSAVLFALIALLAGCTAGGKLVPTPTASSTACRIALTGDHERILAEYVAGEPFEPVFKVVPVERTYA